MKPNRNRYRAWDEKHCEMVSWEQLCSEKNWACSLGILTNQTAHHLTFLQSTELTDKAGIEIFEGDLLDGPFGSDAPLVVVCRYGAWVGVHAPTCRSEAEGARECHWDYIYDISDKAEVIGNIHENPELFDPDFNMAEDEEAKKK